MDGFEKIISVIRTEATKGLKDSNTIPNQLIKEGIIHRDGSIDLGEFTLDTDDYLINNNISFYDGDRVLVIRSGDESFVVVCKLSDFNSNMCIIEEGS